MFSKHLLSTYYNDVTVTKTESGEGERPTNSIWDDRSWSGSMLDDTATDKALLPQLEVRRLKEAF